ncbi:class I SAM-dependent methyltransferase [Microlunatus spumicola]|uniref:Class I SAM-dependent methyltransferase n=1 Tax=Microlunatus spumicola TaxID=81499 RepID=A0ABP6XZG1_9ACTN
MSAVDGAPDRLLTPDVCAALTAVFAGHRYEVDAVVAAIGEPAHAALGRNATVPARLALAGRDDPLATLTRLWLLQDRVPRRDLDRALPGLVPDLITAGILEADDDTAVALVDLRPYASDDGASGWIASDLTPGLDTRVTPMRADFVLGVSSASSTLAQLTVRRPVNRAIDLGTGCGVQSLHLARHAREVVATDLNPRALVLARLTADLNGVAVDLREGDLYEPVAGERFDLVVTNPPYVLSPPTGERLTYREGTRRSDGLVEAVVRQGADHLAEGGVLQVLANWAHVRGEGWVDRVGGWLDPTFDVHVVEREVLDPYAYVELWLADAGLTGAPDYRERYAAWCAYFDDLGIEGVGMGWLTARRPAASGPAHRTFESWPYAVEQPVAPAFAHELDVVDAWRGRSADEVLDTAWRLAPDVVEETTGAPGADDPSTIVLRQQRGLRRAVALDTAAAGVLGACDGELSLRTLVDTVAGLLDADGPALAVELVGRVRDLAVDGVVLAP